MNLFRKQQLRGCIITVLTAALLIGATGFTVISYAAGESSQQQINAIDSRYITAGFVRNQESQALIYPGVQWVVNRENNMLESDTVWFDRNFKILEDGSILWNDGLQYYSSCVLEDVALGAPQLLTIQHAGLLCAHVKGIYGLSSGQQNELQYNRSFDMYGTNFAVLEVRSFYSQYLTDDSLDNTSFELDLGGTKMFYLDQTVNNVSLKSVVSAHPYQKDRISMTMKKWYDTTETGLESSSVWSSDGTHPFKKRTNYLLRCFFVDIPIVQDGLYSQIQQGAASYHYERYNYFGYESSWDDPYWSRDGMFAAVPVTTNELCLAEGLFPHKGQGQENFTLDMGIRLRKVANSEYYLESLIYKFPSDGLPYYAEIPAEMTVEEFLQTGEGRVWREEIIPMAEMNQQSVTVILTDNHDYLQGFISGKARVVEGREIDATEYDRGDKVCMVSVAYAQANGLTVGDKLTMDYHDTGYFFTDAKVELATETVHELTITHNPLQPSNAIGYEAEYEIVGLYTAPEWEFGVQNFNANTIFVPKASVPNAEEYENPTLPLLNSITILNGSADEFEAYMESQGFGGYYQFYDQDYSSNIAGFEAMALNAQRLLLIGGVVLAVTAILFYYLNFRRMIPVARTMRRLGHGRFTVWRQMLTATLPLILLAVLGGAVLGRYSFDYVTELLQISVVLDPRTIQTIAIAEAVVLCIPPFFIAIPISMPNLMKRK